MLYFALSTMPITEHMLSVRAHWPNIFAMSAYELQEGQVAARSVAAFEAAKGAIVLLCGLGLAALIHEDLQQLAEHLVQHMHLNPANHYPQVFVDAAAQLNNMHLWALALGAGSYAGVRLIEAYGLWHRRAWAEWLAAISGSIYLPFEIYELSRAVNALHVVIFACNVLVIVIMVRALMRRHAVRRARIRA